MGESSFWYRPTRVVPDQRPLNGRCVVVVLFVFCAFGALTLLAGHLEEYPACKLSDEALVWLSVRSTMFAYGPADATAIPKPPHLLPHLNSDWFTFLVPEKRPLNGYSSSSSEFCLYFCMFICSMSKNYNGIQFWL